MNVNERIMKLLTYAQTIDIDFVLLTRCDLLYKCDIEMMNINWNKINFPFRQVIYKRWKQLKFRRIPSFNKNEVCNVFMVIPKLLIETTKEAYESYIVNDQSHHIVEKYCPDNIHFIIDEWYQSNCDKIQNPLYTFTRTVNLNLKPELHFRTINI